MSEPDLFKALFARGTFIQPQHGGFEHGLLFGHVEEIAGKDFRQLVHTQRQKLLLEKDRKHQEFDYLCEGTALH